jgi:hypothetical protein
MGGTSLPIDERMFSKRVYSIPSLNLGHYVVKQNSIILMEGGWVGKFLGLWPNPIIVLEWISNNSTKWAPSYYCGKRFSRGMFLCH